MNSAAQLTMVGCNHRHSSLAVRERLAFTPDQTVDALAAWRVTHPDSEAVLLSTCHRVELYAADRRPAVRARCRRPREHLAELPQRAARGNPRPTCIARRRSRPCNICSASPPASTAWSLGEAQILSQVKQAYELASANRQHRPADARLFQAALRVARRVATETPLHRHRVSIPSVAIADFASRIFERFDDKRVLVIGAGKMAQETLHYLVDAGARHITVLNRDFERAAALADQWKGQAAPWSELADQLVAADLVVSTTGADRPVVTLADYQQNVVPPPLSTAAVYIRLGDAA